jgi:hypothetical protein
VTDFRLLPRDLGGGADAEKSQRVTRVMLQMKKLDIAALERAFEGG